MKAYFWLIIFLFIPVLVQAQTAPITDNVIVSVDTDADGLSDEQESNIYFTDPYLADTDADGLSDDQELSIYFTDPKNPDTDGDGFLDGEEIKNNYYSLIALINHILFRFRFLF
jgi:hypothetical protein